MKMLLINGKILVVICCAILLSGCWDQVEIDEMAYVTVIGLDKDEENEGMVKVTYVIANPEAGTQAGGGGATDEPPLETISFLANDFNTSRSIANTVIAKTVTYDLVRVFLVSEKFARDNDFIRWMYDLTKAPEIRRDINLLVTQEDPVTFVQKNDPKLDTRPHKFYELMLKRGRDTGTIPESEIDRYFRITEADTNLFLGIYATTETNESEGKKKESDNFLAGELNYEGQTNTAEFAGSAVFKEGKMIDTLTVQETRLSYLLSNLKDQPNNLVVSLPNPFDEEYTIAARVRREEKIKLDMKLKEEKPSIRATVPINVQVLTNHSMTDLSKNMDAREKLKNSFEKVLNKKFEAFIQKTQEEYGAEPFGWSLAARKKFRTIPEFAEFDWMKTYPDIDIEVQTELFLEGFGRQTELPDLEKVRD